MDRPVRLAEARWRRAVELVAMTHRGFPFPPRSSDLAEPDELNRILGAAHEICEQGDHDGAIECLQAAARDFPDSATVHYDLAWTVIEKLRGELAHEALWEDITGREADFEIAVAAAEEAIALNDRFAAPRNLLGSLYASRGWWSQALEQWEASLAVYPDQPETRELVLRVREDHLA